MVQPSFNIKYLPTCRILVYFLKERWVVFSTLFYSHLYIMIIFFIIITCEYTSIHVKKELSNIMITQLVVVLYNNTQLSGDTRNSMVPFQINIYKHIECTYKKILFVFHHTQMYCCCCFLASASHNSLVVIKNIFPYINQTKKMIR